MNLLEGRSLDQRIEEAIKLFQENGYRVSKPSLPRTNVKTPSHLVTFFYDTMLKYHPDRAGVAVRISKERSLARMFIDSRVETGLSAEAAIAECCELIDLLFKYEDKLGIDFAVTSMGVLGQGKMSWITNRLVQIKDGFDAQIAAEEEDRFFQIKLEEQEKDFDISHLEKTREVLDTIIGKR